MRALVLLPLCLAIGYSAPTYAEDPPAEPVTRGIELFNRRDLDGWYTWLRGLRHDDPDRVFTVVDGQLRLSGERSGALTTRRAFRDYHLVAEWRWAGKTWGAREKAARDSGILVHGVGEDGANDGAWLESIESQIIEGGAGDLILLGGKNKPQLTCDVRTEGDQFQWKLGGPAVIKNNGLFNWRDRDPKWTDTIGFRGAKDIEKPMGEWNRQEVICDGSTITNILNGVVVNFAYDSSHTGGRIQLQSEGAEIYFRRLELRPIRKHTIHR